MPFSPPTKQVALELFLRIVLRSLRASSAKFRYQPESWLSDWSGSNVADRSSVDRLAIIRSALLPADRTILDIGSNAGLFSIELGLDGFRCHGLERDPDLVVFATLASRVRRARNVSFECAELDDGFLDRLERHDVVLNFSVMHHLILHHGLDHASRMLMRLRERTGRVMLLEMGQSDESGADWAPRLPPMLPDPQTWITSWLNSCGFASAKVLGKSEKRFVFAAVVDGS